MACCSGVARNFLQGVRQSVAFLRLSLIDKNIGTSAIVFLRVGLYHTYQKIMYFPDRGCVRPLRHLYGYATEGCGSQTRDAGSEIRYDHPI